MATENFLTWTEIDTSGILTVTATRSTFNGDMRGADNCRLTRAATGLQNFTRYFTIIVTSITYSSSTNRGHFFLVSEIPDEWSDLRTGNKLSFGVGLGSASSATKYYLRGTETYATVAYGVTGPQTLDVGTPYYVKVVKSGVSWSVYVYTDSGFSVPVTGYNPIVHTLHADHNLGYLQVTTADNYATSLNAVGYVEELKDILAQDAEENLFAEFYVSHLYNENINLKAVFGVKQDAIDLKAEFRLRQDVLNLKAVFWIRITDMKDLFATFATSLVWGTPAELYCKFGVRRIYDLSDQGGIGFFWKGVGRGHVDIQILSFTGAWIGKFPDYGEWTWVSLLWEDLQEVDIDGSRPDKNQVTGFLWTYHTPGERHLDGLYGLPMGGDPDVKALAVIRHAAYNELPAYLFRNLFREDLDAEFKILQNQPGRPGAAGGRILIGDVSPYYTNPAYGRHVYALDAPQSKKSFNAAGRYWIFYCEGQLGGTGTRDLVHKSSVDSGVWTTKTVMAIGIYQGGRWAIHWDGIYVHLAYHEIFQSGNLMYRRGIPQSDGIILWDPVQTAGSIPASDSPEKINISTDINGYPFISYAYLDGSIYNDFYVTKSSTNDGTWVTQGGFPYTVSSLNMVFYSQLFPLPNGNMLIIWNYDGYNLRESLWNGITWATINTGLTTKVGWTATIDELGQIHVAVYDSGTDNIYYLKRAIDGSWTTLEIDSGLPIVTRPVISSGSGWQDRENLIIFYYQQILDNLYEFYYQRYDGEAWSGRQLLRRVIVPGANRSIQSYYNVETPLQYSGGQAIFYYATEDVDYTLGYVISTKLRIFNAPELKGIFVMRYGAENLKAEFVVRYGKESLFADFWIPFKTEKNLYARFRVEPHKNLKAVFTLRQLTADLKAEFRVEENLDVYTIVGSSGSHSVNFASGEVTVNEMTKDLVCVAGDKLVVSFDSTITFGSDSNLRGLEAWLDVDGIQIGEKLFMTTDLGGNKRFIVAFTRVYEIPSNGTYTIEIKAQNPVSTATYSFYLNNRTLSIQHFH